MQNPTSNRPLELSQKLYQRLLTAYPRPHREAYGGAMAQLFRDQCRDAWNDRRAWGLATLWLRTLPDLVKTSFFERFTSFNPGKFMSDKLSFFFRLRHSPSFTFWTVFIVVFSLVFSAAVVITFLLPESYASTARIKIGADAADSGSTTGGQPDQPDAYQDPYSIQNKFVILESPVVLTNVVNTLSLNVVWGKKFNGGGTLKTSQSMQMLRQRMDLKSVRNTKLISITAYSDDKQEAARLANAVAQTYIDYQTDIHRAATEKKLEALEHTYRAQTGEIEKLQAEKGALAQKLGFVENFEEVKAKCQTQLTESQRLCQTLQTQLDQLKTLGKNQLRDALPTVTGDSMLTDLLGKLNTTRQTYVALTNDYVSSNLHVTRVQSMIDELNGEIDARVAGIMAGLESEVTAKRAAEEVQQTELASLIKNHQAMLENQRYQDCNSDLNQLQNFHKVVETKLQAAQLDLQMPGTALVQITDTAEPANAPVKPNKVLDLVTGAIIGIFLGGVCGSVAAFIVMRLEKRRNLPVSGATA